MDTDRVLKFISIGLIFWAFANACVKFMPEYATQLPPPVYEFFYSITVNTEPIPSTKTIPLEPMENDSDS